MHKPQKARGDSKLLVSVRKIYYINVLVAINGHQSDFRINTLMNIIKIMMFVIILIMIIITMMNDDRGS